MALIVVMTRCGYNSCPDANATDLINLVRCAFPAAPSLCDSCFITSLLTLLFICSVITTCIQSKMAEAAVAVPGVNPAIALFADVLQNVIGFPAAVDRARIIAGGIAGLADLRNVKEKDLRDTLDSYEKRPANQRVVFGMARTNRMIGLMHHIQDCDRIGAQYGEEEITLQVIEDAIEFANARKSISDHEKTHADSASPGELKDEKHWVTWHNQLEVFLAGLLGVNGVPLSYVIRKQEEPDLDTPFDNFIDLQVARAPLNGPAFQADARKVHNHIMSFVGGHRSEQWIKGLKQFNNGRRDILALRNHYNGAGNVSQQLARAEAIRDTVHYRSEKMLNFEKFLAKCQEMFNIYEEHEEDWTERQKVSFLLEKGKIQSANLAPTIAALKVEFNRRKGTDDPLTFVEAADQISTTVAESVEATRSINALKKNNKGGKGDDKKPAAKKDKKVKFDVKDLSRGKAPTDPEVGYIGFRRNFKKLPANVQHRIRELRDINGLPGGYGDRGAPRNQERQVASVTPSQSSASSGGNSVMGLTVDQLADVLSQRMISASRSAASVASDITDIDVRSNNAGDAFGGRAEAARRRAGA
jgi:hypothetical protein